jgi:hypothetical protein
MADPIDRAAFYTGAYMSPPKVQPLVGPITRSADHRYTFDGKTYPGVTGILSVIDKSAALMSWAARQTAEAALGLIPARQGPQDTAYWDTSALISLLDSVGPEGVVKALTSRSSWKRDEAASLGTEVHRLADDLITGRLDVGAVPPRAVAHVKAYTDWWTASGWTVRASEAMVVNPVAGYGGTLDLLCRDRDGKTVLADIKTGKAVYQEAVLQLTAYGLATYIGTDAGTFAMPRPIDRHVILHVTANGVREVEVNVGTTEHMAWLACIDLALWRDTMKGKRL